MKFFINVCNYKCRNLTNLCKLLYRSARSSKRPVVGDITQVEGHGSKLPILLLSFVTQNIDRNIEMLLSDNVT